MMSIKKIVVRYLRMVVLCVAVVLFALNTLGQVWMVQRQVKDRAADRFAQIQRILEEEQVKQTETGEEGYPLSYILSLLKINNGVEIYAIDMETGEIVGATDPAVLGNGLEEIGISRDKAEHRQDGFHAKVQGENAYCVFTTVENSLLGYVIANRVLYERIPQIAFGVLLIIALFQFVMVKVLTRFIDELLLADLRKVNGKLRAITEGDLEERVELRSSLELSELSDQINAMVESLHEKLLNERQYQAELTEALKMANAANQAKTAFLFSISHDIRTPMNAIMGFSAMAERDIDDRERALGHLKKLSSASENLLRLINDVLDMAQLESDKIIFHPKLHKVSDAFVETEVLFAQSMKEKNIDFRVSCDIRDEYAYYDKLRLEQVDLNLLGNALKFTPSGGTITYTLTQLECEEEGYAVYEGRVKDTGIGMDAEFCKRAFEPFEREQTSTVNGISGTGLGLAVTKRIIDQLDGTISCVSQQGVGSEFIYRVKLKLGSPEELSEKPCVETSAEGCVGKRILLVEDNEFNREIAYEILCEYGFVVDTAEDGGIAVEKVAQAGPGYYDLILMDIQMPNMDGYQATEAIRHFNDPLLAEIPIVALTANACDSDRAKSLAVGMNHHLAKPIDVVELMETLQKFLGLLDG